MPSEVEVTGSPSLKFAANLNFNNFFTDMMNDALNSDGDTKIITCTNPSLKYMVYILRMEIFRKENFKCDVDLTTFDYMDDGIILIDGKEINVHYDGGDEKFFVLDDEETIAETADDEPYILSFNGLNDYTEDFKFFGVQSKVYIYGTEIVEKLKIDLSQIKDDGTVIDFIDGGNIPKKIPSGFEFSEEYDGIELPDGGGEVDIDDEINSGGDLTLKCRIYIEKDTAIEYDLINSLHTIIAEIVIWFPMTLESIEENAVFKFPDFFDGISDVFKSLAGTGCIDNMNIKISVDPLNPFGSGIFVINDDNYGYIPSPLDDNSFFIDLNQEQLDYINKNQFDPSFFVLFPDKNSILRIPKGDIMITTVSLDAALKYNKEF
jgi:hypothetical protein